MVNSLSVLFAYECFYFSLIFGIVLLANEFQMTNYLLTDFQVEKPALIERWDVSPKSVPSSLERWLNRC